MNLGMAGIALALLVVVTGPGHARVSNDPGFEYSGTNKELLTQSAPNEPVERPNTKQAGNKIVTSFLRNPGFEDTLPNGSLAEWVVFREAFADLDTALAHNGDRSVRSSYFFGWFQNLLAPCSPYQSYAIAGSALCEFADERPGIRSVFTRQNGEYLSERFSASPVGAAAGSYGDFWAAQEIPEQTESLSVFLRGQSSQSWPRFDDLLLFNEQFQYSGSNIGESWQMSGGATASTTTVMLPAGASAAQRVVCGLENQAYFVWAKYSVPADTELIIQEDWLPRDDFETTATTTTSHLLQSPGGTLISDPGRITEISSGQARATFTASVAGGVNLTSLRRGFAKVEPETITAGPASPDGTLKLTAAWPDYLTTASIMILDSVGATVGTPAITLHGTSLRAEWQPDAVSSGPCTARFILQSGDGESAVVDRPFEVLREDGATSTIPPFNLPEFTRGAWLYVYRDSTTSDTFTAFDLVKQDGFNFLLVLCRQNQLATVRQAAELHNLPFVVFTPEGMAVFQEFANRSWFSKKEYVSRLKTLFAPLQGSPLLRGIYVIDEPATPAAFELHRRASLSLVQEATLGLPFSVFPETTPLSSLSLMLPPVGIVDVYPFRTSDWRNATDALLARVPTENAFASSLNALGRDLWIMPQGFEEPAQEQFYPVLPSLHSAQLAAAVLAGARGIMPFTYTAMGPDDGLRGPGFVARPKLEAYRSFNQLVDRIGPLLMQLEVPQLNNTAPSPFAVSVAAGPGSESYVFALNADDTTTRTLVVDLTTLPPGAPQDLISEQPLSLDGQGNVPVTLGPGQWALFAIGSNSIASLSALPATPPSLSTLTLPVTHQFIVTGVSGAPQSVLGLDISPDAAILAASVGTVSYEPIAPTVYQLLGNGNVNRETGPSRFPSEEAGIMQENVYSFASPNLGVRLQAFSGFGPLQVAAFQGRTGGAYDVIYDGASSGTSTWLSMKGMGIRQLLNAPSGLTSIAVGRADRGEYLDLFGPFINGSVTVVVSDFGVSNVKSGQLHEFNHTFARLDRVERNASLDGTGLLAVPRHQLGVGLFQLNALGVPQSPAIVATEALDATAAAWVYDRILAVADGSKTIWFYRISGTSATLLGKWRPPVSGSIYMRCLAARNGRIAVGMTDGRVVVADASQLQPVQSDAVDWQLLE